MSYIGQQTNQQSLNGIIDLTDGTVIIQDGDISNVKSLSINGEINMNNNKIINLDDGIDPGDAVNKNQLDSIAINMNDYLKRDGTNAMTGDLNLNNNRIIDVAQGISSTDAINKAQLDLKGDISYIQSQDNLRLLKAGDTMIGNLSMNTTNKIINVGEPTNAQDVATKNYVDTHSINNNYVKRAGDTMAGNLSMNTTNKIINVAEPTNAQDVATKNYVDTHSINNNYVKKIGDTMTGNLNMNSTNKIINVAEPTNNQDVATKSYVDSQSNNNNYVKKTGDTITGILTINKNASNSTTSFTSSNMTVSLLSGTIYDFYDLTYVGEFYIRLEVFDVYDATTTLGNKTIHFKIPVGQSLTFQTNPLNRPMNFNGTDTISMTMNSSFCLICSTTPGYYTTGPYISPDTLTQEQLTVKSNLGTYANSEFTGVKFLHTTTDAGIIRVETDRARNNSTMRFYTRSSNALILPLDISSTINAYKPIIRSQWSSGELIQTKILQPSTTKISYPASDFADRTPIEAGNNTLSEVKIYEFSFTPKSSNSWLFLNVDMPYFCDGGNTDNWIIVVKHLRSGATTQWFSKTHTNSSNGASRSSCLFPLCASYLNNSTTSMTIQFYLATTTDSDTIYFGNYNYNITSPNLTYTTNHLRLDEIQN